MKYNSLDSIENLMKVRRLNHKPVKNKSKQRWLQQKDKIILILQQVNVISLLLLQIIATIENSPYSRMRILHMNCPILENIL